MGKIYTAFAFPHSDKFAIFLLFPSASSHPTSELSITPCSLPCDDGGQREVQGLEYRPIVSDSQSQSDTELFFLAHFSWCENWGTNKETVFSSFIFYNSFTNLHHNTHIAKGKQGKQHQSLEKLVGIKLKDFC